jgi:hypothetical protein
VITTCSRLVTTTGNKQCEHILISASQQPCYSLFADLEQLASFYVCYRLFVTSCYELVVIDLLTTCYVQTISDFCWNNLLIASLLASSTLLQDDNNLFQTYQQLGTSSANTSCRQAVRFTLKHTLILTGVIVYKCLFAKHTDPQQQSGQISAKISCTKYGQ